MDQLVWRQRRRPQKQLVRVGLLLLMLVGTARCANAKSYEVDDDLNEQLANATQHIERRCLATCAEQNRTYLQHTSEHTDCDQSCYAEQCSNGCHLWQQALDSSCKTKCNSTADSPDEAKEQHCELACTDSLNQYISWLIRVAGQPSAPVLVADSLTATSLSLELEVPERLRALTAARRSLATRRYLVQWRFEENAGDWAICSNQSIAVDNRTVLVENLQPYKKYRFRVALILSDELRRELFSDQSVIISTLAAGRPTSPPIVRATAIDYARISVSWEPGAFPNGKILSYDLRIVELVPGGAKGYEAVQDLPPTDSFHVIGGLLAECTYNITVRMRNEIGHGPAGIVTITTPPAPPASPDGPPPTTLVLAGRHTVGIKRLITDQLDVVFTTEHTISGIAIHVARNLLFVSDDAANVYRLPLQGTGSGQPQLIRRRSDDGSDNGRPSLLSVDWLNDRLYTLVEMRSGPQYWTIVRSSLTGGDETVVYTGQNLTPAHFEVDPYNGYLFWSVATVGLFRLDLANVGQPERAQPERVLRDDQLLGPFVVDHVNFELLVPLLDPKRKLKTNAVNHIFEDRIVAVELIGKNPHDLRNLANTQGINLLGTQSLTLTAKRMFYWTNGTLLWTEEFHQNIYYKTSKMEAVHFVRANSTAAQPQPVPVNPARAVQAVLAADRGRLTWTAPDKLPMQGRGAWQTWNYELDVVRIDGDGVQSQTNYTTVGAATLAGCTGDLYHVIGDLRAASQYRFRVRPIMADNRGPWSPEFRGETMHAELPDGRARRTMFWTSATAGLLQTDMLGDELMVESAQQQQLFADSPNMTGMAWYEDRVFFISNATVKVLNRSEQTVRVVEGLRSVRVKSIAVDWLAGRLYWANMDENIIQRGSLDGDAPETVIAGSFELELDAAGGWLYYWDASAVRVCRLNGRLNNNYYYPIQGGIQYDSWPNYKQVRGIALAVDLQRVFWILCGEDGTSVFSAPMMSEGGGIRANTVVQYKYAQRKSTGPLAYVSGRLMWLLADSNVTVANLAGQSGGASVAQIRSPRLVALRSLLVVDDAQRYKPGHAVNVRPEPLDAASVRVHQVGTGQQFRISWSPIRTVTGNATVLYSVKFRDVNSDYSKTSILYNSATMAPYTQFNISIQAHTWWAKSPTIHVTLHSPPARPDAPRNLRVFVQPASSAGFAAASKPMEARIRWSAPAAANGPLLGYALRVWYEDANDGTRTVLLSDEQLPLDRTEYVIAELVPGAKYHAQLLALSAVGAGNSEPTEPVPFEAAREHRVPQLLASVPGQLLLIDLDRNETSVYAATRSNAPVQHIAQISAEARTFWTNENNEIISFDSRGQPRKVHASPDPVTALCVDWLNRQLYWVQHDGSEEISSIMALDLNDPRAQPLLLLKRSYPVVALYARPAEQSLFYLELQKPAAAIFRHSLTAARSWLFHQYAQRSVEQKLPLDFRHRVELPQPRTTADLFYADAARSQVVWDAVDRVFWLQNGSEIRSNGGYRMAVPDVAELFAAHAQSYPRAECLVPLQTGYVAALEAATSNSLRVRLPAPQRPADCNTTVLGTRYTILLGPVGPNETLERPGPCNSTTCQRVVVYSDTWTASGLQAFTAYKMQIGLSHFFAGALSNRSDNQVQLGAPVVFRTAISPPSAPRNLTVIALSPTELRVAWLPALQWNAERVHYEVVSTSRLASQLSYKTIWTVPDDQSTGSGNASHFMAYVLDNLQPGDMYRVSVRASNGEHSSNETGELTVQMWPRPLDVQLLAATATALRVTRPTYEHAARVVLQCIEEGSANSSKPIVVYDSARAPATEADANRSECTVGDLRPLTRYRFSVLLYMQSAYGEKPYFWPPQSGINSSFVFSTLSGAPSAPGVPKIEPYGSPGYYKISWEPAREHGEQIVVYRLESWQQKGSVAKQATGGSDTSGGGAGGGANRVSRAKRWAHDYEASEQRGDDSELADKPAQPATSVVDPTQTDALNYTRQVHAEPRLVEQPAPPVSDQEWQLVCNTTDPYCLLEERELPSIAVSFRVRARNANGWGPWSGESQSVELTHAGMANNTLLLAVAVSLSVGLAVAVCGILAYRCRPVEKKPFPDPVTRDAPRPPPIEMEPRNDVILTHPNPMYTQRVADGSIVFDDADAALLPQIKRDRIMMHKEALGKGYFGEVYEGVVRLAASKNDRRDGEQEVEVWTHQKVAIKTLKKGATMHDKNEFLKEAQLMSNFKHEHIMELIGVCFHADELYIIMELMKCDLLTYLKQSRLNVDKPYTLTLLDIVSICVDIATGCRYLEEMHFVHRDLACRNCLVSSFDRADRVVKISDFGLARDIYNNDYYRTKDKGPLPVRWMSPESLGDAVFTTQSDIWAFGVLCWEVLSLGQRPYPTSTNDEVLQFVREGGRLLPPRDCPLEMHELMMSCWRYKPEDRPTFKDCLEVLQALKRRVEQAEQAGQQLIMGEFSRQQLQHLQQIEMGGGGGDAGCGGEVLNGAVSNRSYLFPDENQNLKKSGRLQNSLRIRTDGHDLIEPPILLTPTSSRGASPTQPMPKYLQVLFEPEHDVDDYDDEEAGEDVDVDDGDFAQINGFGCGDGCGDASPTPPQCGGYEIPLRDCDLHPAADDERLLALRAAKAAEVADCRRGVVLRNDSLPCGGAGGGSVGTEDSLSDGLSRTSSSLSSTTTTSGSLRKRGPSTERALSLSQRRRQRRQSGGDKERTFSSSSTVSENMVFPDPDPEAERDPMRCSRTMAAERLHVALPLDECSSKETLLTDAEGMMRVVVQLPNGGGGGNGVHQGMQRLQQRVRTNCAMRDDDVGWAEAKTIM